jgi:hypothetical protein
MNFDTTEINTDNIRESFAIQSSLVIHELERIISETERILTRLNSQYPDVQDGSFNKTRPNEDIDVYRVSTTITNAHPKKRRKYE